MHKSTQILYTSGKCLKTVFLPDSPETLPLTSTDFPSLWVTVGTCCYSSQVRRRKRVIVISTVIVVSLVHIKIIVDFCSHTGFYLLSPSSFQPYHLVKENMNWYQARRYCREKYSDLATIHSPDIITQLKGSVDSTVVGTFWIGLFDVKSTWDWEWSLTDSDFYGDRGTGFRNWRDGQPDNKWSKKACVSMGTYNGWTDHNCQKYFPYICYDGELCCKD